MQETQEYCNTASKYFDILAISLDVQHN